eukprot:TRINITY_DN4382_c0_g1_i5.p1 TRINITY_DN4382_c0_g1~~TRINITY_DN4382_c0_g1_i5.p1  ORF type:complete len:281 (+),score=42.29 TRINITY_DN4382_c0_g1_i5:401-1243(+)
MALENEIYFFQVTCATAFVVWHYVSLNTFWWWVYPIFFFSISITGHIFFPEEKYLEGVVIISIIVNVMFFITESLTSRNFPHWFLWPAGISIMLGHTIYNTKYSSDKPSWPIYAAVQYSIFNILMFLAWLEQGGVEVFPWFVILLCLTAIPVALIFMRFMFHEFRIWVYFSVTIADVAFMLFLVWGFLQQSKWPWFVIVWGVAVVAIFITWFTQRKKDSNYEEVAEDKFVARSIPEDPTIQTQTQTQVPPQPPTPQSHPSPGGMLGYQANTVTHPGYEEI